MVLHGRAGQRQAVIGPEEPGGLGRSGGGVLDRLRLVENDVGEGELLEGDRLAAKRAVRREHDVVFLEVPAGAQSPGPRVIEHGELRREPGRLLLPVEHE